MLHLAERVAVAAACLALVGGSASGEIVLTGRVFSEDGPVPDARVHLVEVADNWHQGARFLGMEAFPEPVAEVQTSADGRFRIVSPEIGFWSLRVEAEKHAPWERLLLGVTEDSELGRIELQPSELLHLEVVTADGRASDARVSVFRTASVLRGADLLSLGRRWRVASSGDPGTPWRILSTDDGLLEVQVSGEDRLLVRAQRAGLVAVEQLVRGGGTARLTLRAGSRRLIRAVDEWGRPLAGVLVFDERAEVPIASTDENGEALVTWEGDRPLRFALLGPEKRRATGALDVPASSPEGRGQVLEVVLEDVTMIEGWVVDRTTREPVSHALVWSEDLGNRVRTGGDGSYRLRRLGARVRIQALARGYLPWSSTSADESSVPTLAIHPSVTLRGRAVDPTGRGLEEVDVEVRRDPDLEGRFLGWRRGEAVTVTGPGGGFRVRGAPAQAPLVVRASAPGRVASEIRVESLEPHEHREGLSLVLEPGRRAEGLVVDADEEPVPGARIVMARVVDGVRRTLSESTSDGSGVFVLEGLPAGEHDLEIVSPLHAPLRVRGVEVLDRDEATDLGTLFLEADSPLEGRVVDVAGDPIAGAEIRVGDDPKVPAARARQALALEPSLAVTDAGGRFVVRGQRRGVALTLVAEAAGYLPGIVGGWKLPTDRSVEIVLRPPSRVDGRVVDASGRGLPEARLLLVPEGRGGSGVGFGGRPQEAETRDDGTFSLHQVGPGRFTLLASAWGMQDARLSGLSVPEGGVLSEVEVVLHPSALLAGVVRGPEGEPLTEARVALLNVPRGRKVAWVDGDGRFEIDGLAPAFYTVAADHPDFPRVVQEVATVEGLNVVDFAFGGGVEVQGVVRDDRGQAVAGAWVRLVREVRTRHSPRALTDRSGVFVISGVATGEFRLEAGARGYADHRSQSLLSITGDDLRGLDVVLEAGAVVRGAVVGLDSAELAHLRVTARGRSGLRPGVVDGDHQYRIEHLAAGDWVVHAAIDGTGRSVLERVTLEEGQVEVDLDLDFASGLILSGRTWHEGQPLVGARVWARGVGSASSADAVTDPEGTFRLEGLKPGRTWLGILDDLTGLRHSEEIDLDSDRDVEIELVTASVAGRVLHGVDGEPLMDVDVVLEPVDEGWFFASRLLRPRALSDSQGRFDFGSVSEGQYEVVLSRPGYSELRRPLDVRGGDVEVLDLELLPTEGVFFRLRLEGSPVEGAVVVVLDGDRTVAQGAWETSENGRIRVSGVPPGRYEMVVAAAGSVTTSLQVVSPGDLGDVILPRGGSLDVTVPGLAESSAGGLVEVVGSDGRPHRMIVGGRLESALPLWAGRARVPGLPVGPCAVLVRAEDGRTWNGTARVRAGEVERIVLQ